MNQLDSKVISLESDKYDLEQKLKILKEGRSDEIYNSLIYMCILGID